LIITASLLMALAWVLPMVPLTRKDQTMRFTLHINSIASIAAACCRNHGFLPPFQPAR